MIHSSLVSQNAICSDEMRTPRENPQTLSTSTTASPLIALLYPKIDRWMVAASSFSPNVIHRKSLQYCRRKSILVLCCSLTLESTACLSTGTDDLSQCRMRGIVDPPKNPSSLSVIVVLRQALLHPPHFHLSESHL
jgi:hypothetical protein